MTRALVWPRRSLAAAITLPLVAALVALAGCGGAGASDRNDLDSLPLLTVVEERRIGDTSDPEVGFSRVSQVDVDRDGNLFALEFSVPEIRVYDGAGALVRRIGRGGAGPGEFEAPFFGVLGDTVWVVDSRVNRITLFDRAGTLLSTGTIDQVVVPLPASFGFMLPRALRSDGRFMSFLGRVASNVHGKEPTGVEPTDSIPVPWVLFDATGAVVDTAGWAPRPPPRMWRPPAEDDFRYESVMVDGRRYTVPSAPTTLPNWLTLPDGYIAVETPLAQGPEEGVMRVVRYAASGETLFDRALRYTPQPYRDDHLDSIAARAARGAAGGMAMIAVPAGGGGPPQPDNPALVARRLRDRMSFPDFQLPIQSSWVSQDGSTWLRRTGLNEVQARWAILDPGGNPRGELQLPANARVVWNRGDSFWAVLPDDFDVPWLVRFRIEPA
jgi:hypothetical protein